MREWSENPIIAPSYHKRMLEPKIKNFITP
jgi:hypothetical protein